MAQDFGESEDRQGDEEGGEERDDVVGKDESLFGLNPGAWARRLRFWRWQFRGGDCGNGGERNGRGRNGRRRDGLACSGCDGYGFEGYGDLRGGPAGGGIAEDGMARDIEEGLRKSFGDGGIGLAAGWGNGGALRERFDESDAERPDVGGGGERGGSEFWRVIGAEIARESTGFADGANGVGGKLELIGGGENIGGLDVRVREALAVEIDDGVEKRLEHFAGFGGGERALRKNLREIFLGEFHHGIEKIQVGDAAAAGIVNGEKIGMREFRGAAPKRELGLGRGGVRGNKFDGRFAGLRLGRLREEDGAVVRGAEELVKQEFIVGDLAFPFFPNIAHHAPPTADFSWPTNRGGAVFAMSGRRKSTAATGAGWNARSRDSQRQGPGARRVNSRTKMRGKDKVGVD